jgi:hypothetical protein
MDTSFPNKQTVCYRQAARLMSKGMSLSMAFRGCMRGRGQIQAAGPRPMEKHRS